ncbi:hypothetical protein EX30DRAFT_351934 [Ascodesmis nigricans]|uniref:Uncharacterized protein n=1 Tax=Ascodesmis nigricans TaxID=341454 RepID=A0A4S2MK78_9PEZI|nr:hypothetical protein EX30DRAFT_351934 [Ascodesmis nigricans]
MVCRRTLVISVIKAPSTLSFSSVSNNKTYCFRICFLRSPSKCSNCGGASATSRVPYPTVFPRSSTCHCPKCWVIPILAEVVSHSCWAAAVRSPMLRGVVIPPAALEVRTFCTSGFREPVKELPVQCGILHRLGELVFINFYNPCCRLQYASRFYNQRPDSEAIPSSLSLVYASPRKPPRSPLSSSIIPATSQVAWFGRTKLWHCGSAA